MLVARLRSYLEYRAVVRAEADRLATSMGSLSLEVAQTRAYALIDAPQDSPRARLAWDVLHHLERRFSS